MLEYDDDLCRSSSLEVLTLAEQLGIGADRAAIAERIASGRTSALEYLGKLDPMELQLLAVSHLAGARGIGQLHRVEGEEVKGLGLFVDRQDVYAQTLIYDLRQKRLIWQSVEEWLAVQPEDLGAKHTTFESQHYMGSRRRIVEKGWIEWAHDAVALRSSCVAKARVSHPVRCGSRRVRSVISSPGSWDLSNGDVESERQRLEIERGELELLQTELQRCNYQDVLHVDGDVGRMIQRLDTQILNAHRAERAKA